MLHYSTKKKMELIKDLEQYRLANRISQQKLARCLHIHRTTLNRWLMAARKPNKIQTYQIEQFLKKVSK